MEDYRWPHQCHLPINTGSDFMSVLGRQLCNRFQCPATLRVKSTFHKRGQRPWAGNMYDTSEEEPGNLGNREGEREL